MPHDPTFPASPDQPAPDARPQRLRLDDLLIDLPRQRVERGGEVLPVAGLSFRLLACLLEAGTRVVTFDELIAAVWAPAVVNEETVTQRVKLLRQALADSGRSSRYLRSVRGVGYQLCSAPVVMLDNVDMAATQASTGAGTNRRRRAVALAIGVAALAIAAAAILAFTSWPRSETPSRDMPTTSPATGTASDELLQRAEHYARIGQHENNERAIALLEQADTQRPDDADTLIALSRAYSARVCLYNQPRDWAERALALADRVRERSPADARGHAAAGYAHDCLGQSGAALARYEQALQRDPGMDAVRASAAYLYERRGRLADALLANLSIVDTQRARFLPVQIASNLELLGLHTDAEARYRHSFRLYPDSVFSNLAWPRFLYLRGRFGDAQTALDEALQRGTEHADLHLLAGELALLRGDRGEALAAFERAAALRPHGSWPQTLRLLQRDDFTTDAAAQRADTIRPTLRPGEHLATEWLELALLDDAAGRHEAALADLDTAIDEGFRDAAQLLLSPLFHGLRARPGFAAAVDRITALVQAERMRLQNMPDPPPALAALLPASP